MTSPVLQKMVIPDDGEWQEISQFRFGRDEVSGEFVVVSTEESDGQDSAVTFGVQDAKALKSALDQYLHGVTQ